MAKALERELLQYIFQLASPVSALSNITKKSTKLSPELSLASTIVMRKSSEWQKNGNPPIFLYFYIDQTKIL